MDITPPTRLQGQVSRAEQAEEMFILKRELVALRRHDAELSEKMKESTRKCNYRDSKLYTVSLSVCIFCIMDERKNLCIHLLNF